MVRSRRLDAPGKPGERDRRRPRSQWLRWIGVASAFHRDTQILERLLELHDPLDLFAAGAQLAAIGPKRLGLIRLSRFLVRLDGRFVVKLGVSGPTAAAQSQHALIPVDHAGACTGLALIFVGLTLIVGAAVRFISLRRLLDESLEKKRFSVAIDLSFAVHLALLGLALTVYMLQLVVC